MGNSVSVKKLNYEDMQAAVSDNKDTIIINTLPINEQDILISGTIPATQEEAIITELLNEYSKKRIFIYGKNANDDSIYDKNKQLNALGFPNVYVYPGGLFEWSLLQELYDIENFPTTRKIAECLKYKPNKRATVHMVCN